MKRNMQIFLVIVVILLISCIAGVFSLERLSGKVEKVEPEIVLRYGEVNAEGHIMSDCAEYFANQVRILTKGKVKVEIYPSGQLGDDERCYKAMQMGALDLYRGNSNSLSGEDQPMISLLALPYIFEDSDHFWKVCESELGDRILADIEESCPGIKGLAFLDEGARNFFTTEKKITRLEDVKDLRIRVQNSELMLETIAALGAVPVPSEYVELYSSLKGKTVDGAENPAISYYYNRFYEVAPYYVNDMHTYSPGVILVSGITWKNLSEEYREALMVAAGMTQTYNRNEILAAEKETYELMREEGVIITELADAARWKQAMEPVYKQFVGKFEKEVEQLIKMK